MSYSFDIKKSSDLFDEFLRRSEEYEKDKLSSGHAVICAILCWHVVEWVYQEDKKNLLSFPKLKDFQDNLKMKCQSLAYMQDISNGSKHHGITKYVPSIKSTEVHTGAFSSAFSSRFDVSCLRMEIVSGEFVYFDEELEKSICFLKEFLGNKLNANRDQTIYVTL